MNIDTNSSSPDKSEGGNAAAELRTVVHDLRNVVAPLRNVVQLLRIRGKTDAQLAPITDIIERQVDAMVRMLNSLTPAAQPPEAAAASSPVGAPALRADTS